ncbi:hypothetical protein [Nocardia sp. NPDC046763]
MTDHGQLPSKTAGQHHLATGNATATIEDLAGRYLAEAGLRHVNVN